MKWLMRIFFKTVRAVLGPFILLFDKLTTPRGIQRDPQQQQAIDRETRALTLYQFATCPFCIKVRRAMARLSLNIEKRDAQFDPRSREELLQGGGQLKVPCLKITEADGQARWMYESDDIIGYLHKRFD